ncbi:MAG: ATP-binding cassette domain-containing protein [Lachnospiraceae bacterium]|jgi:ABC-2 type transport system ATP-binding protein|nr:ATP-binding cassette domain-containing protein [Lachnospiraceae bacterium]
MEMIRVENVNLKIEKNTILNNVTMQVNKGEIVALIGRNGSGKTMLMKCICGFVKTTSGSIFVNEKKVGKEIDFPEKMGVIIETPGFISQYSGMKNLWLLAKLNSTLTKNEIASTMELVGLNPKLKRHVGKYSLGMRQRLGIAQAIMENPDILILDEPMNGLDYQGVEDVRKLLLNLKEQGKTILIASHNTEDIAVLCDHVWKMKSGEIKQIE